MQKSLSLVSSFLSSEKGEHGHHTSHGVGSDPFNVDQTVHPSINDEGDQCQHNHSDDSDVMHDL